MTQSGSEEVILGAIPEQLVVHGGGSYLFVDLDRFGVLLQLSCILSYLQETFVGRTGIPNQNIIIMHYAMAPEPVGNYLHISQRKRITQFTLVPFLSVNILLMVL